MQDYHIAARNRTRAAQAISRLMGIMEALRSPEGCPWDADQTPETLKPYIIEEAYEVLDAIDHGDPWAIRDELGDLLLQVVFQARIFEERGTFSLPDVVEAISDKLIRRHPHVFAGAPIGDAQELAAQWDAIKAEEKLQRAKNPKEQTELPRHLPALQMASKLAEKLSRPEEQNSTDRCLELVTGMVERLPQMINTPHRQAADEIMGDLLFQVTCLASSLGVNAELALRKTNDKVIYENNAKSNPDQNGD